MPAAPAPVATVRTAFCTDVPLIGLTSYSDTVLSAVFVEYRLLPSELIATWNGCTPVGTVAAFGISMPLTPTLY